MARIEIPFTGEAYKSGNPYVSDQECVNYYIDSTPKMGKGMAVLRGAPGLEEWCDTGTGEAIKGLLSYDNKLYIVSNNKLFKADTAGNCQEVGDVAVDEDVATIITNSLQVGIFGGERGFYYTIATDTLAEITDASFPGGPTATYQDGFVFINPYNTAQFHRCELNDFSTWDSQFSTAGWKPDNLISIFSDHKNIWLQGTDSTEIWYNTGQSGFGFARRDGAEMEIGSAAKHSMSKINNAVLWLGRDENGVGQVFQAVGFQPKIISNDAITEAINSYSDISDAIGFCYQIENHPFYELTFPTGDATWVYDLSTSLWHERQSWRTVGLTKYLLRHRIQNHAYFAGKHLVGDIENGKIYEFSRSYFDEDGQEMPSIRTSGALSQNQDLMTVNEFQVQFTPGVGLTSGQGNDPIGLLSWSVDGGYTWSNERHVEIGKKGQYERRARTWQMGQGRNWLFRSKVTDPVNRDIMAAFIDAEKDNA